MRSLVSLDNLRMHRVASARISSRDGNQDVQISEPTWTWNVKFAPIAHAAGIESCRDTDVPVRRCRLRPATMNNYWPPMERQADSYTPLP